MVQSVLNASNTGPESGVDIAGTIRVLTVGGAAFNRFIACIDAASHSIAINIFIWRDDPLGNRIGRALLKAADRGVEVSISKDRLGAIFELGEESRQSFFHKKYGLITAVKQRAINAYSSSPDLFSWVVQECNELSERLRGHDNVSVFDDVIKKDHSKFTIIDDKILFIGGMNFEERLVSIDVNGLTWNDYLLECSGIELVRKLKDRLSGGARGTSSVEFVINDRSGVGRFELRPCIIGLLNGAKKTCRIEMAYVGDPTVTDGIVNAVNRGVDVQIIIPAWANIQNELNLKTMCEIFSRTDGKASVYLSPGMLHSKMMDIDGQSILIGSANFNERSLNYFSELNLLISGDSRCADTIRRTFSERRKASKKVTKIQDLNYRKIKELCEFIFG